MPIVSGLRRRAEAVGSWWLIVRSGLFDRDWYAAQGGQRAGVLRAAAHYVARGRRAGLSPHPLVEPSWYAPLDWAQRSVDPFASVLRHPDQVLTPHPLFDPRVWAASHPEALRHRGGPLGHFAAVARDDTAMPLPPDLLAPFPGAAPAGRPAVSWGEVRALLIKGRGDLGMSPRPPGAATVLVVADPGWPTAWVSATSALRSAAADDEVRVLVLVDPARRGDAAVLRALTLLDRRFDVRPGAGHSVSADLRGAAAATAGGPVLVLRPGLQLWPGWLPAVHRALADPGRAVAQATVLGADGRVGSAGLRMGPAQTLVTARGRAVDDLRRHGPVLPVHAAEHGAVLLRDGALLAGLDPALAPELAVPDLCRRLAGSGAGTAVTALDAIAAPATRLRRGVNLRRPAVSGPRHDPGDFEPPPPSPGLAARWVIKTAMPVDPRSLAWGDLYFARCLAAALERLGRQVVIDRRPAIGLPVDPPCEVELVLRGLEPVPPRPVGGPETRGPGPVRLMWVISHPDQVADVELAAVDLVFAASMSWSAATTARTGISVRPLLQATDPGRFHPHDLPTAGGAKAEPVLFAGNSRGVFRPVVRHLVEAGIEVGVYGGKWGAFLGPGGVRAEFLPNDQLAAAYASAGVVLNDHWEDMRRLGFISNRVFDAAACGARVVSDRVEGMEEMFGGLVRSFSGSAELVELVRGAPAGFPDDTERRRIGEQVGREHSFDQRARTLLDAVLEMSQRCD